MKKVGIIGGMGPLATIDLFEKIVTLTNAKTDQENIPLLIDNATQIPDRTSFVLGKGENPLPQMIESAKILKNGGCEAICMACNTAHFFADAITSAVDIKLLHIAKIAVESIKEQFPNAKTVAVIATTATKKAEIYDKVLKKHNLIPVDIDKDLHEDIMSCIYDGVKAGRVDWASKKFEKILNQIDADIFIAGCTEIPVMLPFIKTNKVFLDATNELAKAVIKFSRGYL